MPMYEYRCRECGELYEEIVKLNTQDSEVECPACGAHQSERKQSTFAVRGGSSANCGPTGSS